MENAECEPERADDLGLIYQRIIREVQESSVSEKDKQVLTTCLETIGKAVAKSFEAVQPIDGCTILSAMALTLSVVIKDLAIQIVEPEEEKDEEIEEVEMRYRICVANILQALFRHCSNSLPLELTNDDNETNVH